MEIDTTRFGKIDIKESEIITMKGPILGFHRLTRFVLLIPEKNTPLWWFQSIDDSTLAFVVINPHIIKPDYFPSIPERDIEFVEIQSQQDIALLSIVTVRSHPFRVTANLRAPILINAETKVGLQIVLDDPSYPIQYDVIDHKVHVNTSLMGVPNGMDGLHISDMYAGGCVI